MKHHLKIRPKYYKEVVAGNKPFELRKNDRDYKVGDVLVLQEYNHKNTNGVGFAFGLMAFFGNIGYTGKEIEKTVTYILQGPVFGLEGNYVILGFK